MERVKGIEPSSFGWEPKALPLSYTREGREVCQHMPVVKQAGAAFSSVCGAGWAARAILKVFGVAGVRVALYCVSGLCGLARLFKQC